MTFVGTKNFTPAEVACKCGCGMLPQPDFMQRVQRLRDAVGFPLHVSSAARCPTHNAKVSGTGLTGPHTTGRAIDLAVSHLQAFHVLRGAIVTGGFTGIGVQQKGKSRFIHLDDLPNAPGQPRPTVWSY
jgi:uncharacterized protein YcbK (DUF882 family)